MLQRQAEAWPSISNSNLDNVFEEQFSRSFFVVMFSNKKETVYLQVEISWVTL
jgi:hypothetical protein